MAPSIDPAAVLAQLRTRAEALGFGALAVAHTQLDEDLAHLRDWLADGCHGSMDWMARDPELRTDPARLHPGTISVICVTMDYATEPVSDSLARLSRPDQAYIARYALGRDYHKVLRGRLRRLCRALQAQIGPFGFRAFADSAPILEKRDRFLGLCPILEKALARNAGIGWIGKNTLLMNRERGSMFFLGEIYTDLALPASHTAQPTRHCGSCRACIEVCPTAAITAPGRLDARRCISYLTIEHRGAIPEHLRPAIGNRIFGCDDCQLVCPWNKYARRTPVTDFAPRHGLEGPDLIDLFGWSQDEFLRRTEGMALRRAGYHGWLRNLAVALGNAPRSAAVVTALRARQDHPDAMVREHVRWALSRHAAAPPEPAPR